MRLFIIFALGLVSSMIWDGCRSLGGGGGVDVVCEGKPFEVYKNGANVVSLLWARKRVPMTCGLWI